MEPEQLPFEVRVLLVNDDLTVLNLGNQNLEQLLRTAGYTVTTSASVAQAFALLRENKNAYDIIICDNDADDDGVGDEEENSYNLARFVSQPVVMLASERDMKKMLKAVAHGVALYMVKPMEMKEVRMLYQVVLRGKCQLSSNSRKRKDNANGDDTLTSSKKSRVRWTAHLHQKFVEAVYKIGLEKSHPSEILNIMKEEGLTRQNVASHLQKYRLHQKKLNIRSYINVDSRRHAVRLYSLKGSHLVRLDQTLTGQGNYLDVHLRRLAVYLYGQSWGRLPPAYS